MSEARIGRLVAAALHDAVAANLPFRVEFYEHWLQPPRLRAGTVGMASFLAVLSFLRQEGDIYSRVVEDAGRRAAEWMFASVSPWTRARWRWLPRALRLRVALRLARRLAAESSPGTRGRIRWRRRQGRFEVEGSAFCHVRASAQAPLCGFYAAALERLCELLGVTATVGRESCRAMGASACTFLVGAASGRAHPEPTIAHPGAPA